LSQNQNSLLLNIIRRHDAVHLTSPDSLQEPIEPSAVIVGPNPGIAER
jgi:hypothetical protein